MRDTSSTWKAIAAGTHWCETKVNIDGTDYGEDMLISVSTTGSLFENGLEIGNAVCGEIDIEMLLPSVTFSKMAEIKPYIRVCNTSAQSEWLQKGDYFIDTREITRSVSEVSTIKLHGYDAMLKAEQDLCGTDESESWPKADTDVVSTICSKIGVELDSRSDLDGNVSIPFPGYEASALSCREVLKGIGALYGGNWYITDEGKLRLIRLDADHYHAETSEYLIDEEGAFIITNAGEMLVVG